jgi:GNAT superfamily N-acetyltransferase
MSRDALSALDYAYLDANRIFVSVADTGIYVERRDVAIVSCGLPVQMLNWGFLKPPYDDLDAAAEATRAHFAANALRFQLSFRADHRASVRGLEARGWQRMEPTPVMTLAIPASTPAPPAGLSVREVRTPGELVGFREGAFRGFGFPVRAAHIFINERILAVPRVRLYAGLVGDAVVATSIVVATGDVAGIYWVATLEEQRGRGFGAALTWAAVAGGRELGCAIAYLGASKLGRPVYARMGFAHLLDYEYLHPAQAVDAEGVAGG